MSATSFSFEPLFLVLAAAAVYGYVRLARSVERPSKWRATLFGLGISPGVIGERLGLLLASTSLDFDAMQIDEVLDASGMPSADASEVAAASSVRAASSSRPRRWASACA